MPAESNPQITVEPAGRHKPTLRERKKERTRRTIRTEAFRLFREQGYGETTVEQIAEAAEVSPSTFFRYFPSKEQVVLADDLDPLMVRAIATQPRELPLIAAVRAAIVEAFDEITTAELEFERERMALVYSVPELRGAMARELERNIELMSGIAAERLGRSPDDFEIRAMAGAMTGAMLGALTAQTLTFDRDQILRVIDFLAAGMPL
ncbi:TetR family transcriptional regulator [Nocardia yamanashiensis]|uniref:acyl-CoA-like ligand-binding transcription factor n=1 Tax=Nocardia yamanashiensis TaxID=209247 RepID=UPI001E3A1541|nr:TetR family transcriptional regulator [Nocardia yamanashiensis]UGT39521.1 TetR family transcriptional regulator [Nocardia yamanashiensis]